MEICQYKVNDAPQEFKEGSVLLTHGEKSFVDSAIRFGQRLELTGQKNRPYTWFNHAACVMKPDGTIMEMLSKGASINNASKYLLRNYAILDPQVSDEQTERIIKIWQWIADNHIEYSWLTISSIMLKLTTKSKLQLGASDALICSGAATVGLCASDLDLPGSWRVSPGDVLPCELAQHWDIKAP